MRRLVPLLALAALACDPGGPSSGGTSAAGPGEQTSRETTPRPGAPAPSPAPVLSSSTTSAALSDGACTRRHEVPPLGWKADLPCDCTRTVAFENASSAPEVIRQRVVFQGPTKAHLVVDAWDVAPRPGPDARNAAPRAGQDARNGPAHADLDARNADARQDLDAWLATYRPFALYSDAEVRGTTRSDTDARTAVRATTPGGNSPPKHIVLLAAGDHVYRLMYVDTDAGASAPAFRALVSTFDGEVTP